LFHPTASNKNKSNHRERLKKNAWLFVRPSELWPLLGKQGIPVLFGKPAFINPDFSPITRLSRTIGLTFLFYILPLLYKRTYYAPACVQKVELLASDSQPYLYAAGALSNGK